VNDQPDPTPAPSVNPLGVPIRPKTDPRGPRAHRRRRGFRGGMLPGLSKASPHPLQAVDPATNQVTASGAEKTPGRAARRAQRRAEKAAERRANPRPTRRQVAADQRAMQTAATSRGPAATLAETDSTG
jgi:hypothetical protein